jgi:sugar lactone lactonase YvrE
LLSALPSAAQPLWISTIQNSGLAMADIVGITADGNGNIYYSDALNGVVGKITPDGVCFPAFVGNPGIPGSADGTGSSASFHTPSGLAFDSAGNVYVADAGNETIRKITPSGVVTTIAGIVRAAGYTDGPLASATFKSPTALALDPAGNIYVADTGNRAVRKISPAGIVSTVALTANGGCPTGIALDGSGNIFVSEGFYFPFSSNSGPYTIDKITAGGTISTLAGQGAPGSADGTGAAAQFNNPQGLAVDAAGNVFVADSGNFTIREITPAGVVTTVAGNAGVGSQLPADGLGGQARLGGPLGMAAGVGGNLYIADFIAVRRGISAANTQGAIRFTNVSALGTVAGSSPLVAGFIVQGSATQTLLVRAVGPTLEMFGIPNFLANPLLKIYNSSEQVIGSSADGQNLSNIESAARLIGTYPLNSLTIGGDVGIVMTLPPGAYTATVTGQPGSSGTILLEVYEVP